MLLLITVKEDDRIIHRQGKLEHYRDRIGNEGDGSEHKVGTHLKNGTGTEGYEKYRYFGIGLCGYEKHRKYDYNNKNRNNAHFVGDKLRLDIPEGS